MYFLPKLHKDPLGVRPIVSATNGPTKNASAFLDRWLQPYMKQVKSHITNATELIHILQDLEIPKDAYLVTLDVESLYTNITHEEAIMTLLKIFKSHPLKVFLLDLLKYVLKNNVFKFNDHIFTQVCGIAMGTKLAPALATIYMGEIEEEFLSQYPNKPSLWVRYIDDIFMVWPHSLEDLHEFIRALNNRRKKIKLTAEISTHSCDFLDLTIYKSPTFYTTGKLSTKIFYKPTNTFSYPLGTSHMPASIHKGIAIGEMTRLIRNTTSPNLRRHYSGKLIRHFRRRKYPPQIIKSLISMKRLPRTQILRQSKKS